MTHCIKRLNKEKLIFGPGYIGSDPKVHYVPLGGGQLEHTQKAIVRMPGHPVCLVYTKELRHSCLRPVLTK